MLSKNTKVLFIPAWYPSRVDQLAGIFTERHAIAMKSSVSVAVLYVCAEENLSKIIELEQVLENEIPVFRVYFSKRKKKGILFKLNHLILYAAAMFWGYYKVRKYIGKPDIHHVHVLTRSAVLPMILYWLQNVPYVITEHWSRYLPEDNTYKGWFRKRITEIIVKNSKGVSCVSNALREGMKKHGLFHWNYQLISNVVDTDLFAPKEKQGSQRTRFLHVSSFDKSSKNVLGIIDAAWKADQEGYLFDLHLVGGGPEKAYLQEYVSKLSFKASNIILLGELYGADLVKQYQSADAFILFSFYENQPCVVLESFSCGLPVIGSRAGGIPELVTEECGLLVESQNTKELTNAMIKFITKDAVFDKRKLRQKALDYYSYQAVEKQFCQFYQQALISNSR